MADDQGRLDSHETMLRSLTAMVVKMDTYLHNQEGVNERLTAAIERMDRTLAQQEQTNEKLQRLLERFLHPGGNGH